MKNPQRSHPHHAAVTRNVSFRCRLSTTRTQLMLLLLLSCATCFLVLPIRAQPDGATHSQQSNHNLNKNYLRSWTLSSHDNKEPPPPAHYHDITTTTWLSHSDRFLVDDANCTQQCCDEFFCKSDEGSNPFTNTPLAFQIILIVLLILFSAFFSGLTLGLMGLDKTGLEIVMSGDDPKTAAYAKRIYPLRKRGNLLLCTLLLGNVCVNSLLSILTADKFGGAVGLVSSTFLIVIFGEILPQALCQRYSLQVGSAAVPFVKVIIVLLFPVAFPLSFVLDKALGEELATTYSNSEMIKLLQIHVQEEMLDPDTATAMKGALNYKSLTVKEVMTPVENAFMLSSEEQLNFETVARIFKTGYSRIPVYNIDKNNVIGLLFVKDLIFIDPEDNTRVSDFVDIFGRGLHVVWPDDSLGDVLRELKSGKSHMALVRDVNNEDESQDPFYEVKGIITLEDIIEEIIGDEIVDETDAFVENTNSVPVDRTESGHFQWASLRLLDSKLVDERLSLDETKAVTAHLSRNFDDVFKLITELQLQRLIMETPVSVFPTAEQTIDQEVPDDSMYNRHVVSDVCTLVLSGKVTVLAGEDGFRSDVSSWSLLGGGALIDTPYKPDFTAWVSAGPCRCLRITRARFAHAVDMSIIERKGKPGAHNGKQSSLPKIPVSVESDVLSASEDPTKSKSRKGKFVSALKAVGGTEQADKLGARRTVMAATIAASEKPAVTGPTSVPEKVEELQSVPEGEEDAPPPATERQDEKLQDEG